MVHNTATLFVMQKKVYTCATISTRSKKANKNEGVVRALSVKESIRDVLRRRGNVVTTHEYKGETMDLDAQKQCFVLPHAAEGSQHEVVS